MPANQSPKSRPRLKSVILPTEHGGWGMLFEPIVLGLLLAPSVIGVLISLIAISTFLMRPPIKIIISDWQHQRRSVRTAYAQGFVFCILWLYAPVD